jgi:5-formyltetrahydrofolate cyclo-ligase
VVSGYWPFADEADPRPLLAALHGRGHGLCLPVTVAGEALTFRAWAPGEALVPGPFDTREPRPEKAEQRPDCLLVPLLAVDGEGYRLGYGGGFYDRTLAALGDALGVGLAFAFQRCEQVPRGAHDRPLDWLVSEDGAMQFERAA